LLSFDDEEQEEQPNKILISSHDVLSDPRLSKEAAIT
jgi:hypothetical protein